ncbi:MAG: outer membrane beta-barrel protein [Bacteroidota bacterium]
MKKTFILLVLSFFTFGSIIAQDSPKGLSMGKGEKIILNLYSDMWQGADSSLTVNSFNPGFAAYFMYNIPLGKSKFSFKIGFGIGSHNLHSDAYPIKEIKFDSASATDVYTGNTIFERIPGNAFNKKIEYDVNKLSLTYFDVPVEFKYSSENKKGKAIKFALGFKAGYLINGHTKYRGTKYESNIINDPDLGEADIKIKVYKIFNIETLRYGATVRFNYGMYGVFGYYSLSKIFKAGKGVEMYPISVGIALALL